MKNPLTLGICGLIMTSASIALAEPNAESRECFERLNLEWVIRRNCLIEIQTHLQVQNDPSTGTDDLRAALSVSYSEDLIRKLDRKFKFMIDSYQSGHACSVKLDPVSVPSDMSILPGSACSRLSEVR